MEILAVASSKQINIYAIKGNWRLDGSIQSKIIAMAFSMAAEFALNRSLREAIEDPEKLDLARVNALLDEARADDIPLDGATLGFALRKTVKWLSERFLENPGDLELARKLEGVSGLVRNLPFEVNVWRAQNNYYQMLRNVFPEWAQKASQGNPVAKEWVEHFVALGRNLSVKVEEPAAAVIQKVA